LRFAARREFQCPWCGFVEPLTESLWPSAEPSGWHLRGRNAVHRYIASLGEEAREWLLALYVDRNLNLLAVDTAARGTVSDCPVPFGRIYRHAVQLKAEGFILVHNHPSGDPRPSQSDLEATRRIRSLSRDLDMPLIEHLIVAKNDIWII
jgi:DNA repair protein RadC